MMGVIKETSVLLHRLLNLWKDTLGQDLIEYALMAAGFAMATAAFIPNLQPALSEQFSKIINVLNVAGAS